MRQPTITAGEPEFHGWCPTCGTPTRIRIPLHIGDVSATPAGVLEICPGCGTGHDRPSVTVAAAPSEHRQWHPLLAAVHALHRWVCRRRGRVSRVCAHGDCRRPGLYRHEYSIEGDEGQWRYVFCSGRHRRAWAAANHIRMD